MVMKSSSTGNLNSLVGSFLGASHDKDASPTVSKNAEFKPRQSRRDTNNEDEDKPRRRSNSVTRLMDALRNSTISKKPADGSSEETSLDNNKSKHNDSHHQQQPKAKTKRSRSRSRTRLTSSSSCDRSVGASSHCSNPFDAVGDLSLEEIDAKLKEIRNRSDEDVLAEMFKTAGDLEDMAKAARRARRRKTGSTRRAPRRTKSSTSQNTASSGYTDCEQSHSGSGSGGSVGQQSTRSTSFTDALISPFTSSTPNNTNKPRRRLSFNGGLLTRSNSESGDAFPVKTKPHQPRAPKRLDTTPIELPDHLNFKPSYYHDSDDEDDDLVLDADEDLDDFARQVQQDVQNMVICVSPNAA